MAQYTYDALNRRIGVTEGGATTWTVYDGTSTDPLIDFDGSGDVTARYLYGPSPAGVDAVLARDTPSGGVAWYLADRLGSVGDIVNNSGTVIDHIDYSAYGQVLDESDPSEGDRFKFAGMQYDAVIGQYYDNARWYDPGTGRFISSDTHSFASGDANLYRYVGNEVTNDVDPTGFEGGAVRLDPGWYRWCGNVAGPPLRKPRTPGYVYLPWGGTYYPGFGSGLVWGNLPPPPMIYKPNPYAPFRDPFADIKWAPFSIHYRPLLKPGTPAFLAKKFRVYLKCLDFESAEPMMPTAPSPTPTPPPPLPPPPPPPRPPHYHR